MSSNHLVISVVMKYGVIVSVFIYFKVKYEKLMYAISLLFSRIFNDNSWNTKS